MAEHPTGTVTFLFTDIEGSTRFWEEHALEMRVALERHDEILRSVIDAHDGYVFSTGGDGFGVAFQSAGNAIAAALEAQEALTSEHWPVTTHIRVRMGLHTGEVQERSGDYFGPAVNIAARVMSAGHGMQTLVTDTTRQLLTDTKLTDLGEYQLKGVTDPARIWQLGDNDFGPLRVGGGPGNLPSPVSSFVGRRNELSELVELVAVGRTLSLVGVGGAGKTRLAIETADRLRNKLDDGVYFCDLAPIGDPASVIDAVASSIGIRQQPGLSMLDSITDSLVGRRVLVVLDNCEHVLEPTAALAYALNKVVGSVAVVATSREPLGIPGERVWQVPSLDAAVELFVARAGDTDATFDPSNADLDVIGEICSRLDGMPLAIELAAARTHSMTVADIASRLEERFRLLRGSGRGGVERHHTLAATVQWSYDLLSDAERMMFDRLCVFAGTFDTAAVVQVFADSELVDEFDVIDSLASLTHKSMLIADRSGVNVRYRLLETFRQFGEQKLAPTALVALKDRHLDHYIWVARSAMESAIRGEFDASDLRYRQEWDNIRAAMLWALANEDRARAASMLEPAYSFAFWNLLSEVGDWAHQCIAFGGAPMVAYGAASFFHGIAGEFDEQIRLGNQGLEVAGWAATAETFWCWGPYSGGLSRTAGFDIVEPAIRAAYTSAKAVNAEQYGAYWAAALAITLAKRQPDEARQLADEAQELITARTHPHQVASALIFLSRFNAIIGDLATAAEQGRQALSIAVDRQLPWETTMAATHLAFLASLGALADPKSAFHDAVQIAYRARAWFDLLPCLHSLVRWWIDIGQLEPAGVLFGHLTGRQADQNAGLASIGTVSRRAIEAEPQHHRWTRQGANLDRNQVIGYVVDQLD